jgi:hypothetical protein
MPRNEKRRLQTVERRIIEENQERGPGLAKWISSAEELQIHNLREMQAHSEHLP